MPRVGSTAPVRAAGLLVASAAVALAAACGGNSGSSGGSTGPAANGGANAAFAAYADCLKKNGVPITLPSGGPRVRPSDGAMREPGAFPSGMPRPYGSAGQRGGGFPGGGFGKPAGVDDATWQKAQAACASVRPSGRPGGRAGNRGNGMDTAYANCLRQHGVTLSGSAPSTGDPAVKKALDTCQVLKPTASATPGS